MIHALVKDFKACGFHCNGLGILTFQYILVPPVKFSLPSEHFAILQKFNSIVVAIACF